MEIGTPIKLHECKSMVKDTRWWGASCTCARATFIGALLVKESALLNLNIAISTILAQGSAIKQCRPLKSAMTSENCRQDEDTAREGRGEGGGTAHHQSATQDGGGDGAAASGPGSGH